MSIDLDHIQRLALEMGATLVERTPSLLHVAQRVVDAGISYDGAPTLTLSGSIARLERDEDGWRLRHIGPRHHEDGDVRVDQQQAEAILRQIFEPAQPAEDVA